MQSHEGTGFFVSPLPFKPPRVRGFTTPFLESMYEEQYGAVVRELNQTSLQAGDNVHAFNPGRTAQLLRRKRLFELFLNSLADEDAQFPNTGTLHDAVLQSYDGLEPLRRAVARVTVADSTADEWIILAWARETKRMVCVAVNDAAPIIENIDLILALPPATTAVQSGFSGDRSDFAETFLNAIAWDRISDVLEQIVRGDPHFPQSNDQKPGISICEYLHFREQEDVVLLDVRLKDDRVRYGVKIPESSWIEVHDIESALNRIPGNKLIVAYCLYGFWVSQDAASTLRKNGIQARYLEGGISAWRAMGYQTERN